MNYQETLDYLYNSLPTYHRIGASAFKPTLENTLALCSVLGNPQHTFKSIHIAGTNGKGSVSHMLAAILQQAGYKTALFTSPHLKSFTERIKINGKEMPAELVTDFVEKNKHHFENIRPSFFEMTTAMAFDYFSRAQVDIAVIEVGLGGRLDSTNIIHPILSVITNISYDHQDLLGNTLIEIASEKAAIIKQGVPVVIGEYQEELHGVFEKKSHEKNASLIVASEKYRLKNNKSEAGKLVVDVFDGDLPKISALTSDLSGNYQLKNIPTVLAAVDVLKSKGWDIGDELVKESLSQIVKLTGLKGRWQILHTFPMIVCDTAHNEAGIKGIVDQIRSMKYRRLHIVLGTVNDKDVQKILSLLPKEAFYYFCQPNIPRGLDAYILQARAQEAGLKGEAIPKVSDAIARAKANASSEDMIFIGGSNFVVAEIEEL